MNDYFDRNGKKANVGDIMYYNEGEGYAKSINKIIENNGELYSKTLFYDHYVYGWTECDFEDMVELKYLCGLFRDTNHFSDAEIIDANEDGINIDWLNKTYPLND